MISIFAGDIDVGQGEEIDLQMRVRRKLLGPCLISIAVAALFPSRTKDLRRRVWCTYTVFNIR